MHTTCTFGNQRGGLISAGMIITSFLVLITSASSASARDEPPQVQQHTSQNYVGDASCTSCHIAQGRYYEATAHRRTLQAASRQSILGSFASGMNVLPIVTSELSLLGDRLSFKMMTEQSGFSETAKRTLVQALDNSTRTIEHTEHIDLVTGAGVRGQSYLYWKGDQLFELPVSYWTDGNQWINSPGYPDGSAIFDRPVSARCLECHTTFIQMGDSHDENSFAPTTLIAGITCEKCHGPGALHVEIERRSGNSDKSSRSSILNPRTLNRDLQVDQCALCHNGTERKAVRPAFSFAAGEFLESSFLADPAEADARPEVHGNQVALLKRSSCYRSSPKMTCSTCHNEHAPERAAAEYSSRCLECHQLSKLRHLASHGPGADCVRCHMPVLPTKAIVSVTSGKILRAEMRTHWIKVYDPSERQSP
jgi:hypothetical protein